MDDILVDENYQMSDDPSENMGKKVKEKIGDTKFRLLNHDISIKLSDTKNIKSILSDTEKYSK